MHARVVTFEGGNPAQVREMVAEIKRRSESGPPEGVPAVGFLLLHSGEGKVLSISLFDNEDDLRQGDESLNAMNPPTEGGMGRRSSVETYEVGVKIDA